MAQRALDSTPGKLILLDAFALIAHVRGEPAANEVDELLRAESCGMPAINLAEVVDNLRRRRGLSAARVAEVLGPLLGEVVEVVPVDERIAWRAADLRAAHYRRADLELSLADCVLLSAGGETDAVATADRAVATVARSEGLDLITLPDSRGNRP
ncbi:MAG: PIN domain-containing protein [Solirubrobacterales bacterium]